MTEARRTYMREYMRVRRQSEAFCLEMSEYQRKRYFAKKMAHSAEESPLADVRRKRNITQRALADMIGASQASISRLESGVQDIESFKKKGELLAILGVVI